MRIGTEGKPASSGALFEPEFRESATAFTFCHRVDMCRFFLVLFFVPALTSVAAAQGVSGPQAGLNAVNRPLITKPHDMEGAAAKARAAADAKYRRINKRAKAAVNSMCSECLGAHNNQNFEKAPLILSDELSQMVGSPQLEVEP